jgi:hypothetical protein
VNLGSLRAGRSQSCGCRGGEVRYNFIDRTGQRFGKLAVVRRAENRPGRGTYPNGRARATVVRWLCICDCGNEKITTGELLHAGHTKSCGCVKPGRPAGSFRSPLRLPPGQAVRNRVLRSYRKSALERGLSWELTEDEFDHLIAQDCAYCGCAPGTIARAERSNGDFIYNGIDRKDNTIGYAPGNTLPCCPVCNHAKKDMPYDDFIAWIGRLARFQQSASRRAAKAARSVREGDDWSQSRLL